MSMQTGIAAFHGRERFIGPTAIQVNNNALEGRKMVVAAGAKPAGLKIPGETLLTTSEQFLELDVLPQRIVFVV